MQNNPNPEKTKENIDWLVEGDVSIQYQVHRDLLRSKSSTLTKLQNKIEREGWGKRFLGKQLKSGHWGKGFYRNRWANTHYTLLDLKNLGISQDIEQAKKALDAIFIDNVGVDGGINPSPDIPQSDVCLNGMFLNYATYFGAKQKKLESVIDFILEQIVHDGGFNCRFNRSGCKHSSLHSTLSVAEGIREYAVNGYKYRLDELLNAEKSSQEFILMHRLYRSDRTGDIIDQKFLRLPYPSRWRYDILRALDYLRLAEVRDTRVEDALEVLNSKRKTNGQWNLQAYYPGTLHFKMEPAGKPSRWNTLRAMRVLKFFK